MPTDTVLTVNQAAIAALKNQIKGPVIVPGDASYEQSRKVFYKTGSPAVIVCCQDNDDVAAAIRFARDNRLPLSVRSGGHSGSGASTNDNGVVIDLTPLNNVEIIDPAKHIVRIGAGARWGDAAKALGAHHLAISSGDTTSVGVGGLTLGGGVGWMVRKYGLALDSLAATEIVTADGRVLRASEQEHADLFWAVRGGGGNFGVVTAMEFIAHPCTAVTDGQAVYSPDQSEAVLSKWANYMRTAPEELSSTVVLFPGFGPDSPPQLTVLFCVADEDEAAARQTIEPLLHLGNIQNQTIHRKPYDQVLQEAHMPPAKVQVRNGFIKTLDHESVAAIAANYGKAGGTILQIRSLGGAMNRVDPAATAFAHRDYEALAIMASIMPLETEDKQAHETADTAWRPLQPFTQGTYSNFLTDTGESNVTLAYPPATLARLAKVKAAYDPDNLFRQNLNIKPAND